MSASQDKNQKFTFVYSNLYQINRKPKNPDVKSPQADGGVSTFVVKGNLNGKVLKTGDLHQPISVKVDSLEKTMPSVRSYNPAGLLGKRLTPPESPRLPAQQVIPSVATLSRNEAIESLKGNLKSLNNLHARLRFMLKELEDLVKN